MGGAAAVRADVYKRQMLRISAMNLMLHSITNPEIDYKDSVSKQNSICSKYTCLLYTSRCV